MAAEHLLRLDQSSGTRESVGILEVEHYWRIQKKARAAPDLLGEVLLEGGVTQQSGAHHHDGEYRALHEIARHPRTDAACHTVMV